MKRGIEMYNDYYGYSSSASSILSDSATTAVVMIVCLILSIIGGIALLLTFLSKKNEYKFTGFLGWLYKFLNFKTMFAETLLRALYIVLTCWLSLSALVNLLFVTGGSIGGKLLVFLLTVTLGNIALRLVFEFSLVVLVICRNTSEMNHKLGKGNETEDNGNPTTREQTYVQQQYTAPQYNQQYSGQEYQNQSYGVNDYSQPRASQNGTVYCANCGQLMNADSKSCSHCGYPRQ